VTSLKNIALTSYHPWSVSPSSARSDMIRSIRSSTSVKELLAWQSLTRCPCHADQHSVLGLDLADGVTGGRAEQRAPRLLQSIAGARGAE
jgi:hypothetical protein